MTCREYELGNTIFKTTQNAKLWKSEKGIVQINENTLAIPIKLDGEEKGYIFHGHGKLLLDTIVETEEGAIGKPLEKQLNHPFIMLGCAEETPQQLSEASEEDLTEMGYESQKDLIDKAEDLFNRFFKKGRIYGRHRLSEHRGVIFAFQNQNDKLDILAANGPRFVYTSKDVVFVSNRNKVVLKSPDEVVCSSKGRSVIFKK